MAKHACPSCGKRFDFEKNGWICPYCGSVVLHSMEQNIYAEEQREQQQKEQNRKQKNIKRTRNIGKSLWQRAKFALLILLIVCVISFGGAVFQQWRMLHQLKHFDTPSLAVRTISCGENIPVSPYTVQIIGAQWADQLPGFPAEVQAPSGGRYLTVFFTCSFSADSTEKQVDVLPDDVMWTCLDAGNGYLLPQYPSNLTGSDAIERKLYDLGVGYQLDTHSNMLVFLVDEKVQPDQLALHIYTGVQIERLDMKQNDAKMCYEIPLEVIS